MANRIYSETCDLFHDLSTDITQGIQALVLIKSDYGTPPARSLIQFVLVKKRLAQIMACGQAQSIGIRLSGNYESIIGMLKSSIFIKAFVRKRDAKSVLLMCDASREMPVFFYHLSLSSCAIPLIMTNVWTRLTSRNRRDGPMQRLNNAIVAHHTL